MTMSRLFLVVFIAGFLTIIGCGESYYFEEQKTFQDGVWTYQDSVNFEVDIQDTVQLYALLLDINHSVNFKTQNLYVYIYTQMPNGERLSKQLNIDLAEPSGKWFGDCSGQHCNVPINLQKKAYFNQLGKYKFTIKQYMREDLLKGINNITFKMKEIAPE